MKEMSSTVNSEERNKYRFRAVANGAMLGTCVGIPILVGTIVAPEAGAFTALTMVAPAIFPLKMIKEDVGEIQILNS